MCFLPCLGNVDDEEIRLEEVCHIKGVKKGGGCSYAKRGGVLGIGGFGINTFDNGRNPIGGAM